MKFLRTALLGAAGLVALSLSAHAASLTTATDTPAFKPRTTTELMQLAQRSENPGGGMFRNENPGGGMFPERKSERRHVQEVEEEKEEVVKAQGRFTGTSLRPGATRPGLFHVSRSVRGCERGSLIAARYLEMGGTRRNERAVAMTQ